MGYFDYPIDCNVPFSLKWFKVGVPEVCNYLRLDQLISVPLAVLVAAMCIFALYRLLKSQIQQTYLVAIVCFLMLYSIGEIGRQLVTGIWYDKFLQQFPLGLVPELQTIIFWFFALNFVPLMLASWLFCFKYWQTFYKLKFLFHLQNDQSIKKERRVYLILNIVGFSMSFIPFTVFVLLFQFGQGIVYGVLLTALIFPTFMIAVQIDAFRRMNYVVK